MELTVRIVIALVAALVASAGATRDLVEYHHAVLDHYFLTGDPAEVSALDSGAQPGWARTGYALRAFDAGDARLAGASPVCRFAGNPARGLGSHFYSALPQECEVVRTRFAETWLFESDEVFRVHLPDASGRCPAGTVPVHRLFNNRADANHRYTSDATIAQAMLARGYLAEGVGSATLPVVFCAADTAPARPVSCTLTATTSELVLGAPLRLDAACDAPVARYEWRACSPINPDACDALAECSSATTTCAPVGRASGRILYALRTISVSGAAATSSVVVTWLAPPTSPPACTLAAEPPTPYAGASTLLVATCTQSPTSYQWNGCSGSTGPTCRVSRATTGTATYSVTATNGVGTSAPASITLNWQTPPPVGADLCYLYDKVKRIDLAWGWFINTNDPGGGFEGDAVLAAKLVVPANAAGTNQAGLIRIVELVDGPAERIVTLSPSPCDFRGFVPGRMLPTDPTGQSAPLGWGYGINPSVTFALAGMPMGPALVPGQTYYVNVRNVAYDHGGASCATPECNVRVTVSPPR